MPDGIPCGLQYNQILYLASKFLYHPDDDPVRVETV
jgi:hypothetical protein